MLILFFYRFNCTMQFTNFSQLLQKRLRQALPGDKARYVMAPELRQIKGFVMPNRDTARIAGVLLMLYPHNNTIYTALMKRVDDGYPHSGQISFPGGRKELEDANLQITALRETEEEFGVNRDLITIIGQLTELYIPASNSLVYPSIGILQQRPHFTPNKKEVDHIIEVSLPYLLNPNIIKQGTIRASTHISLKAPYYDINGQVLWGATAMMMSEFLSLAKEILA